MLQKDIEGGQWINLQNGDKMLSMSRGKKNRG